MTPQEQIDLAERFQKHVNRQEWDAATAYLHPDFEVVEAGDMPYAGTWRGPDGFVRLMTAIRQTWSTWRDEPYPYEWASIPGKLFKDVRFTATLAKTGVEVSMGFVEVYEFKDDKILTVRPFYFDPGAIAAANRTPDEQASAQEG